MKNTCSSHIILILIIFIMKSNIITAQGSIGVNDTGKTQTLNKNWSQDEEDVKATVDQFLIVAGNYDLVAMAEMMAHKASLAKGYAQAWCSQKPDFVASFFSEDGSLSVNNGDAAVGRTAITEVAKGFMDAFPDMIVTMDRLLTTPKGFEFHWTLTGTNTGPNGTGKKVKISGFEIWQLDENGLIKESKGSFDSEEYNRQLKFGAVD